MKRAQRERLVVFTVGHSTRPIEDFLALMQQNAIRRVIDIRTIPKSRHNPQYNREGLARALRQAKIGYTHLKSLGGLRRPRKDSINGAWRNASFRGYADYMQTPEFERGLERGIKLATTKRCALMCAEAVPWRCHRSLVADALTARGIEVKEIVGTAAPRDHKITPFAKVRGGRITYPAKKSGD